MLAPLIGVSVGPSRTLSKVGFYISGSVEVTVFTFARFAQSLCIEG